MATFAQKFNNWTAYSWLSGHFNINIWGWLPMLNIWDWLPILNNSIVWLHAPGSQTISESCMGLVTLNQYLGLATLAQWINSWTSCSWLSGHFIINIWVWLPMLNIWGWLPILIIQLLDYMLLALKPFLNLIWGWLPLLNIWGWLPLLNDSIVGLHAPGSQAISLSIFGAGYPFLKLAFLF